MEHEGCETNIIHGCSKVRKQRETQIFLPHKKLVSQLIQFMRNAQAGPNIKHHVQSSNVQLEWVMGALIL